MCIRDRSNAWSSGAEIAANEQGIPSIGTFVGFGGDSVYGIRLNEREWESGSITVKEDNSYGSSFIMPFDASIKKLYVLFANRNTLYLDEGITMRPFVVLAVAENNNLTYRMLPETLTFTEPYAGGEAIPKYSVRRGSLTDLNVNIPEGTLTAIIGGWMGEGLQQEEYGQVSISGGIYAE